jgi:hypothetical protein
MSARVVSKRLLQKPHRGKHFACYERARLGAHPMPFSYYRDSFDPETLIVLEVAFLETWHALQASGGDFDQEATRNALAELIVSFAAEGETDPKQLKRLALASLPRMLGTP